MRSCTWAWRTDGSCILATCALQRCVGLLVDLAGPAAAKMDYVRTICCALLYNTQWHDDTPGAAHVEECCEAGLFFSSLILFPVVAHWMLAMALLGLFSWA